MLSRRARSLGARDASEDAMQRSRSSGSGFRAVLIAFLLSWPSICAAQLTLRSVTTALSSPVFVCSPAADTRLFVVEQPGRIRIVDPDAGTIRATPFLDIVAKVSSGGERGLLSMAFHPDFASNGYFFVNYTNLAGDTVIERYRVSSDVNVADPASGRTLLIITQPAPNHNGGQLQVSPRDGTLYVGMGDGGGSNDPECNGQRTDTLLGKMLRLDVRQNLETPPYYGVPASNPFASAAFPRNLVWADGLRNPWRFSFDRTSGDLYIADVGQADREEIDYVPASSPGGANFGWSTMEGTLCKRGTPCPTSAPPCGSPALTAPVHEYGHDQGCSVTGGYVLRGPRTPGLTGQYVYGDFCSGRIWSLRRAASGVFQNTLLTRAFGVIPTFGEGPSGRTFVVVNSELMELSAPVPAVPALPGLAPWALAAGLALAAGCARLRLRRRGL
jgi:glucose/arabinose dehydrogenase